MILIPYDSLKHLQDVTAVSHFDAPSFVLEKGNLSSGRFTFQSCVLSLPEIHMGIEHIFLFNSQSMEKNGSHKTLLEKSATTDITAIH